MRSLVYLFDRPILPFYNKGTKLSLVIIVLPWFFNIYATASHSFCKLRVRSVRSVCLKNESRVPNKIRVKFVFKKISCSSVSAPPRTKICEIRVLKNIRVIRVITSLRSVGLRRISCSKKSRVQVCQKTFVLFELFVFKKNIEWHFVFQDLVQPSSSPIPSAIDSPSKCHR